MAYKFDASSLALIFAKIKSALPTKTSDLTNDSGFITTSDIPEGAAASTTSPKMAGTAAVGSEMAFARGDHVHPSDTSRVPTTRTINGKPLSEDITLAASDIGAAASGDVTTLTNRVTNVENNYVKSEDLAELTTEEIETAWSNA